MRKIFYFVLAICLLSFSTVSCSDDKDDQPEITSVHIGECNKFFNGTFHGERYDKSTNTTECEDIVFSPFERHKTVFGVLTGEVNVWSIASVTKYVTTGNAGDHLMEVKKTCFVDYPLTPYPDCDYNDTGFSIVFYPCDGKETITGSEDKRFVTLAGAVETQTGFKMRPYGTTEENDLIYTKR